MFLSFNLSRIQKILLSGVLSLVLGGCPSGQPMGFVPTKTVPTPVVSEPAVSVPQPVNPGDEIGISIRVDSVGGTELTYEWVLTEGKILEGEGTSAITYQAPMEPGTYSIRVKVTSADVTIERSTFINVDEAETTTLTNKEQMTATLTSPLSWVTKYVKVADAIQLAWQQCPGESPDYCVTWNMYKDNKGVSVSVEILQCKQDGTWTDTNRIEKTGLDVGTYNEVSGMTIRDSCPVTPTVTPTNTLVQPPILNLCGEPAFNGNLQTADPVFLRPEGYLSGWISSDPSTVVLPNGTTKVFSTQYVLIIDDLPSVQVKGVQRSAGKANTSGCWYSADLAIDEDAKQDFCQKKAGNNVAVLYRVNASGFEELATTATISCP